MTIFRIRVVTNDGQLHKIAIPGVKSIYDAWMKYVDYRPYEGWLKAGFEFCGNDYLGRPLNG
jgi:hypothetical protein